jgi:hypothetical protein
VVGGEDYRMTELPIHICQVDSPQGPEHYVSCLDVEQVFKSGYVVDQRTRTPQGAVPSEDIVGAFEVKKGECLP